MYICYSINNLNEDIFIHIYFVIIIVVKYPADLPAKVNFLISNIIIYFGVEIFLKMRVMKELLLFCWKIFFTSLTFYYCSSSSISIKINYNFISRFITILLLLFKITTTKTKHNYKLFGQFSLSYKYISPFIIFFNNFCLTSFDCHLSSSIIWNFNFS